MLRVRMIIHQHTYVCARVHPEYHVISYTSMCFYVFADLPLENVVLGGVPGDPTRQAGLDPRHPPVLEKLKEKNGVWTGDPSGAAGNPTRQAGSGSQLSLWGRRVLSYATPAALRGSTHARPMTTSGE